MHHVLYGEVVILKLYLYLPLTVLGAVEDVAGVVAKVFLPGMLPVPVRHPHDIGVKRHGVGYSNRVAALQVVKQVVRRIGLRSLIIYFLLFVYVDSRRVGEHKRDNVEPILCFIIFIGKGPGMRLRVIVFFLKVIIPLGIVLIRHGVSVIVLLVLVVTLVSGIEVDSRFALYEYGFIAAVGVRLSAV